MEQVLGGDGGTVFYGNSADNAIWSGLSVDTVVFDGSRAEVLLSTGTSFLIPASWSGAGFGDQGWVVGDFNGDGRSDLMRYVPGQTGGEVFLSIGNAFAPGHPWTDAGHGADL